MKVLQGDFDLARYPAPTSKTLRAWDAADEFLRRHMADTSLMPDIKGEILIVNDNAGALSTALARHRPKMLSDSYLAQVATRNNLARNTVDASAVQQLASFDPLPSSIDVVVMKIWKVRKVLKIAQQPITLETPIGGEEDSASWQFHRGSWERFTG